MAGDEENGAGLAGAKVRFCIRVTATSVGGAEGIGRLLIVVYGSESHAGPDEVVEQLQLAGMTS